MTVYVVDDDAGVLTSLARLLEVKGYEIRTCRSAQQFFSEHDASVPGCAIIDVALPDCNGLKIQERLVREGAARPLVFLSATANVGIGVQAMKAGAVDFLTKPVQSEQLFAAIHCAIQQDTRIRQERRDRSFFDQLLATLTPREREVLMHVIIGRLNKQIAGDLGTAEKTIKVHRGRMMTKLGVRSVAELVRLSTRAKLLPESCAPSGHPIGPRSIGDERQQSLYSR
jgi:FixJ family two-component response regulator